MDGPYEGSGNNEHPVGDGFQPSRNVRCRDALRSGGKVRGRTRSAGIYARPTETCDDRSSPPAPSGRGLSRSDWGSSVRQIRRSPVSAVALPQSSAPCAADSSLREGAWEGPPRSDGTHIGRCRNGSGRLETGPYECAEIIEHPVGRAPPFFGFRGSDEKVWRFLLDI